MGFLIIYDGKCNLCVSIVQLLAQLDGGKEFQYAPMQDQQVLDRYQLTTEMLAQGMMLIDLTRPQRRWQGSSAMEEVAKHLPVGDPLINFYRQIPPLKWLGDLLYAQVRDHRYQLWGERTEVFTPPHAYQCNSDSCKPLHQSDRCLP